MPIAASRSRNRDEVAHALKAGLISPNVADSNGECANVVDTIDDMSRGVWRLANAVEGLGMLDASEPGAAAHLSNTLLEAADKIKHGLFELADAVREHNAR